MSKTVDFELVPETKILNETEADLMFDLMGRHTHGYCHALTIFLAGIGYGKPMLVKNIDSPEIIHSFIKTKNGMSLDGGGLLPVTEMLERYIDCADDRQVSDFVLVETTSKQILEFSETNAEDLKVAKQFWELALRDYGAALEDSLGVSKAIEH